MRASYRNLQFVSTNQLTRWKSNQPITFKGNFCFELWLVENVARLTQQRKTKLNENTTNRLVNITLASSSCFSSFVVFLLACVRDLFNSLYCSAKRQCCNVVKNKLSCAVFDNRLLPCPCISFSSYFLSDFVYKTTQKFQQYHVLTFFFFQLLLQLWNRWFALLEADKTEQQTKTER